MRLAHILLIFALVFAGCGSKKSTYQYDSNTKFDSIYFDRKITVYPSLRDTIYINNPCDSIGVLKPFKQQYTTAQGNVIFESKNGRITASINLRGTADTITTKGQLHKEAKAQVKEIEVVRYRTDWKLILLLILSVGLNIYLLFRKK